MGPVLPELKKLSDQQTIINRKLDLVITKDDLKASLIQIKQDILSTVQEKMDKLEEKLFQKQIIWSNTQGKRVFVYPL